MSSAEGIDARRAFARYDELTKEQQSCLLSAEESADLNHESHSESWWTAVGIAYADLMESGTYSDRN
jgi:hypothetical protein